jgi:hypothetical protein
MVVNAVMVGAVTFGLGMSSRPNDYGRATVLDIPLDMLLIVLLFSVPGPLVLWVIFRSHGKSALGALLALLGFALFAFLLREGVRV